uniref:PDZ and LIM domain 5a n=1 Tax=Cyprinus carpio carpio TaxID=630221 RepID=A0A9J7YKI9_CYPCA
MSGKYSVVLQGPAPWGFRLHGGKDFNMPLSISRLIDGGKAAKAGVAVGDLVLSIDGISTDSMNHLEDDFVEIIKPVPMTTSIPSSYDMKNSTHITSSSNRSTGLFGGAGSPHISSIPSDASAFAPASSAQNPNTQALPTPTDGSPNHLPVVPRPSVYNTPISLYSNENACEVAMGQRRGLLESQGESSQLNGKPALNRFLRKPIIETDIDFYHVPTHGDASRTRIMEDTEDWCPRTGTSQSRSFRILAQITGTESEFDHSQESESAKPTKVVKINHKIGPRYLTLRDWHHGSSAQSLNFLSLV